MKTVQTFQNSRNKIHTLNHCCCCSVAKLCPTLCYPMNCSTLQAPWGSPGNHIGVGRHFLLQLFTILPSKKWPLSTHPTHSTHLPSPTHSSHTGLPHGSQTNQLIQSQHSSSYWLRISTLFEERKAEKQSDIYVGRYAWTFHLVSLICLYLRKESE